MIDLHCHLDGSITPEIAKKLAALQNISLPAANDAELLRKLSVPEDCESLNEFLECFGLPCRLLQTKEGITEAVRLVQEHCSCLFVHRLKRRRGICSGRDRRLTAFLPDAPLSHYPDRSLVHVQEFQSA